ncbi:MAG: tryptophan-rich sensory protein [Candidatus Competibacteraceae bacterium]|nr:tryptophan-rich sensory protein [Candidatus Competibacteraceae bacterium]
MQASIQKIATYLSFLVLSVVVASVGGWATSTSVETWYATLQKPSFNPPSWLFGPVWSILYLLIAISAGMICQNKFHPLRNKAIFIYLLQLILNLAWSFLFFYFQQLLWAFIEILLLGMMIGVTIILFYRINRIASYLLIPYFLWVSFASLLNFFLFWLNR